MHWNKRSCMILAHVGLGEGSDVKLVMLQFQIQKYSYKYKWFKTDRVMLHTEGPDKKCEVLTEEVLGEIGVRV